MTRIYAAVIGTLLAAALLVLLTLRCPGQILPAQFEGTCQVDAATANRFAELYNRHLLTVMPREKHDRIHEEIEKAWERLRHDRCW